jgi:hypothetical protein
MEKAQAKSFAIRPCSACKPFRWLIPERRTDESHSSYLGTRSLLVLDYLFSSPQKIIGLAEILFFCFSERQVRYADADENHPPYAVYFSLVIDLWASFTYKLYTINNEV